MSAKAPGAVRGDRTNGPVAIAAGAVRICGVEIGEGACRLPCRDRQAIGRRVDVRLTHRVVELFHDHKRVASHVRRSQRCGHVTVNEHMPKAHQRYANTTPANLIRQAAGFGANTAILVERMMRDRPHPEQGYRSAFGILSLARRYERDRLEAACARALTINAITYSSVKAILKSGLDRVPPAAEPVKPTPRHRTPTSAAAPIINEGRKPTMLTHTTLDQMQALGLGGMAAAYRDLADQSNADDLSRDDWLGLMLGREAANRTDKRLTNRLRLRTSGRPARPFRALPAHAASVRGSRSGGLDGRFPRLIDQLASVKAKIPSSSLAPYTQMTPSSGSRPRVSSWMSASLTPRVPGDTFDGVDVMHLIALHDQATGWGRSFADLQFHGSKSSIRWAG